MSASAAPGRGRRRLLRDPRFWLSLAITAVALWLALRDVDFRDVGRVFASANLVILIGLSVPAYLLSIWVRALRWRRLTDPIQRIGTPTLARAVSVGFMANNIYPFRIGEVVRAWYLSRETGVPAAALLGTVLLERVIDVVSVVAMALTLIALRGSIGTEDGISLSATPLLAVAVLPVLFLIALRKAPERAIGLGMFFARPLLPQRFEERVEEILRRLAEGLNTLRGESHLFWIAWHSVVVWGVLSPIPFYAALVALHLELPSNGDTIAAAYTTLILVGAAVAVPSAPGFSGTYHLAAKWALVGFGFSAGEAIAYGTLAHATFWVTMTLPGVAALRAGGASLDQTLEAGEAARDSDSQ